VIRTAALAGDFAPLWERFRHIFAAAAGLLATFPCILARFCVFAIIFTQLFTKNHFAPY
jgi:hypothetical protein